MWDLRFPARSLASLVDDGGVDDEHSAVSLRVILIKYSNTKGLIEYIVSSVAHLNLHSIADALDSVGFPLQ